MKRLSGKCEDPRCQHGTRQAYTRWKCRCDPCVAAKRTYMRDWAERNSPDSPSFRFHGTRTGYCNLNCRCADCCEVHTRYQRDRRRAKARQRVLAARMLPAPVADKPRTNAEVLQAAGWKPLRIFWRHPDPRYGYALLREQVALAIVRGEAQITDHVEAI